MTEPLTPSNCDLSDFPYMPVDIMRLFNSEFHALTSDAEWRAGVTLWLKSFHQVPAGSIPADDIALTRLAELGRDTRSWKKVRAAALRGWITCSDGRLYHPVVCEKVLEAWIGKLSQRLLGGAGNAKRWGTPFDEEPAIVSEIMECRRLLSALNPQSHILKKRPPKSSAPDSLGHPAGSPASIPPGVPQHIPQGSQENLILRGRGRGIDIKPNLTAAAEVITPNSASGTAAGHGQRGTRMVLGWTPRPQTVEALVSPISGNVPAQFVQEQIPQFVDYWLDRGESVESWDGLFRKQVLDRWKKIGHTWRAAPKPTETGSAFDRLQDRSWAAGLELTDDEQPDDDTPRLSAGGDA